MNMTNMKTITIEGVGMKSISINGVEIWSEPKSYTNLVPTSTDTDGSIYNGVGYKDDVRLSSSGGISGSAQVGGTTTGFIPWNGDGDVLRMKGVTWEHTQGRHYYVNFYDASKNFLVYFSAAEEDLNTHVSTVTRENGVTTIAFNQEYGNTNSMLNHIREAKYIRICAEGEGADMIVTINEEI